MKRARPAAVGPAVGAACVGGSAMVAGMLSVVLVAGAAVTLAVPGGRLAGVGVGPAA